MVLNYVNTGFLTVMVLVSEIYNLQVNTRESNPRRMLAQIVQNMSRVQNVLEKFIKHFEKMESTAEEYSDQTAEEVSEVNDVFDKITKPAYKLQKSNKQKSKKLETRRHGNNNKQQLVDNNSRTFKFKTSKVREFTINTSTNASADDIVRGHRRVNANSNDEIQYEPIDLPQKYKNTSDAFTKENIPTTSDKASQTTYKLEISAAHDSSSEKEKIAQDEILMDQSLRQSYNEACKTVINKKCKRALETVLKDVCNPDKSKCTGKFQSYFKDNGQTGCDALINEKSACCRMGHDYPELRGTADISEPDINDDETKLLRAKTEQYEEACNKSNYMRCFAACEYAVDKFCGVYECDESKLKAIGKSCQRRCRENYGISDSDTT